MWKRLSGCVDTAMQWVTPSRQQALSATLAPTSRLAEWPAHDADAATRSAYQAV